MKKTLFAFLAVSMIAILALAACSTGAGTPAATMVQDTQAVEPTEASTVEVQDTQAVSMTDAEMEALITEKIRDKHTLDFILQQSKTAEEWSTTIDRMIQYGAKITPEEKAIIIDWLVNRKK